MNRRVGWGLFALGGVAGLMLMSMLDGLDAGLIYTPLGFFVLFVMLVLVASTIIKRAEHEPAHILGALLSLILPTSRQSFLSSLLSLWRRGQRR